jgi:hypothetical protein
LWSSYINTGIALERFDEETGGMSLLPGSHASRRDLGLEPIAEEMGLDAHSPSKEEEVEYLQLLVAKYGTNFMAMAKDIKANYLQHSASHLETRCTRLEKWLASESKSEYM